MEAATPGHVAAVREYLIGRLDPADLAASRRIATAVKTATGGATPPE
ncbi:hypothetical protein [Actinoplanes sp. G11-F43]